MIDLPRKFNFILAISKGFYVRKIGEG